MKKENDILEYLKKQGDALEIPESITPEEIKRRIKQQEAQKAAEKKRRRMGRYRKSLAVAASFLLIIGMSYAGYRLWSSTDNASKDKDTEIKNVADIEILTEEADTSLNYPEISYEDIYASMNEQWKARETLSREEVVLEGAAMADGVIMEDAAEEAPAADVTFSTAEKQMNAAAESDKGATNVQTAGVDEGDIVKNDGRYLYQIILVQDEANGSEKAVLQIIDTKDGLKEVSRIDDFKHIQEFYVWEDILVTIETKYLEHTDNAAMKMACYDVWYFSNEYHEISFYNLTNREKPEKIKTFTMQGSYQSSRITEGYFYGFSKYYATPGEGEKDYDSYIPKADGVRLLPERIYLPEENEKTSYLVLIAVDLKDPAKFTDTTAIVADANHYYVSRDHIYVADVEGTEWEEGWNSDKTVIHRFSYGDGKFCFGAKGEIKGSLDDRFSMDEYDGHLRVVSTVREFELEKVTDDRTGETFGMEIVEEKQTNALYVLDKDMKMVGKIEGLAENEQIYSARFMGETGYFVTFRQTDPLFAVDLKDPENPKILSELKVSGFSEYLHFYGEGRLFGLGMEADEETGRQEGMKLSMFDISDPGNVIEISRLPMPEYGFSEALYNHHAVLISPEKNLIGFEADSYGEEYKREYVIFSYDNENFVQKLKVNTRAENDRYYQSRGTYIGNVFYLLRSDGTVQSYNLNSGELLEKLEP